LISPEPITFGAGVVALWLHKQLELVELGHNIAHRTYDRIPGAERFRADRYRWTVPVDLEGWQHNHNHLHHGFTNVVGRDPDARFGASRLNAQVPRRWYHRFQWLEVGYNWSNLLFNLNLQVTGLVDFYMRRPGDEDILPDRRPITVLRAHRRALGVSSRYALREYVLFPVLAGPLFPKVLAGNWLSSVMRNVFTGVAIYSSHVGEELADFPDHTRAHGKAEWYLMQLATTKNFEVGDFVSILVGGLDRQVEHHLFPLLPPNRLRALGDRVRTLCEKHGAPYHSAPWSDVIRGMARRISHLSRA
jgi:linoleoyl-CoA desaturase